MGPMDLAVNNQVEKTWPSCLQQGLIASTPCIGLSTLERIKQAEALKSY